MYYQQTKFNRWRQWSKYKFSEFNSGRIVKWWIWKAARYQLITERSSAIIMMSLNFKWIGWLLALFRDTLRTFFAMLTFSNSVVLESERYNVITLGVLEVAWRAIHFSSGTLNGTILDAKFEAQTRQLFIPNSSVACRLLTWLPRRVKMPEHDAEKWWD